ncbi:hypothetical protein B0H14DRAFT_3511064 [Mycena olivaceomarginata]|nr:hypothetical protein B0H14DRAFT_3511064 [Mycena olivaceomarginata]
MSRCDFKWLSSSLNLASYPPPHRARAVAQVYFLPLCRPLVALLALHDAHETAPLQYMMFTQGWAVKALAAVGVRASNALVTTGPGAAGLGLSRLYSRGCTPLRAYAMYAPNLCDNYCSTGSSLGIAVYNTAVNIVNTLVAVHMLTSSPHPILGSFTDCIGWKQWAGLTLFAIGISMEIIAEDSRRKFKKDSKNKGKIDDTGLWSVVRHPNYLGFLLGRTGISLVTGSLVSTAAHAAVQFAIFFFGGVPEISGSMATKYDAQWMDYKKRVPVRGKSSDTNVYAGLRRFHQGKGFDPESQDVARHLGYPLYEFTSEVDPRFADVEDEDASEYPLSNDSEDFRGSAIEDEMVAEDPAEDHHHLSIDDAVEFAGQIARMKMPAVRRNRRLQDVVRTSLLNPGAVAIMPDPYPSDGVGVNYLVTRDLVTDVVAHEQGLLDDQGLLSRREIKLGESQDFDQRLPGYRACQHMYRHEWKVVYTTSERKLTEHLVQDETRFARRRRTVFSCHKRHTEWVDYLSVGGEQGMQNEFLRWIALRGLITIIKYIC